MLRVDCARWGQTPEDLRRLAMSAPHQRTRERFLALYEVTQASCATRVAARTRRPPQPVMEWLHLYNGRGPEALAYRRTGGRPPLPGHRGRPRRGRPCRPARRGGGARSRGRPGAPLDPAAPGRLGGRGMRPHPLPRDDPPRPASPGAVVEEGPEAARPIRSGGGPFSSGPATCWPAPGTTGICWSTSMRRMSTKMPGSATAGRRAAGASGSRRTRRA
jgi:hypothetical protein